MTNNMTLSSKNMAAFKAVSTITLLLSVLELEQN